MKRKLNLPKGFKELARAKTGYYWSVVLYSKKLNRTLIYKYDDGVSEYPTTVYDISY